MKTGSHRLLVVHPETTVGEDLAQRLRTSIGHTEWCQEGVEGIRRCYQQRYDVVLVARWLKDMDAFELVEKVRFRDQKVPCIILLETANEAITRQARTVGRCKVCSLAAGPQVLEALLEEMLRTGGRQR